MLIDRLFDRPGEPGDPVGYFSIVFVLVASIVLHELGHALVASWEGDPTPKIRGHLTWNPVVHMGWLSLLLIAVVGIGWGRTPVTPSMFRHRRWGAVLVAGAGPAVNLLLACLGALIVAMLEGGGIGDESKILEFWKIVLAFNLLLFLFNLIPIPPLDGFSVADGTFDLGELGELLKRAGFLAFVVAILIVNSDTFFIFWKGCARALLDTARLMVGA